MPSLGDSVGYEVGRLAGPWLLQRRPPNLWRSQRPRLQDTTSVRYTLALLDRYGGPAVFLGRFIAVARVVVPGLAGMSGIRYRTFLLWNILGGLCWGVGYTMLGYVVGVSFEHVLAEIGLWSLAVVGVLVVGAVAVEVRRRRRERRRIAGSFTDTEGDDQPGASDAGSGDRSRGTVRRRPVRVRRRRTGRATVPRAGSSRGAPGGRSGRASRRWPGAA